MCFGLSSPYEILVEGKKIIGSAQKVRNIKLPDCSTNRVFLQHGSIQLKDTISLIKQIFPRVEVGKLKKKMHSLESTGIYPRLSKKTHLRNMVIVPEMIGSVVGIYNGKQFINAEVKPEMIGHYLAEFSITYKPIRHGRPGLGSTNARFIPG